MLGVPQKIMRMPRGQNRLNRNLHIPRGPVLKAHRARKPRHQFPVHLALRRPRSNRAPAHQVRQILRRDHIQKLRPRRHSHLRQVQQQMPRLPQPVVDLERLIQVGIINQSLPSQRRARLLKVNPHHDAKLAGKFLDSALQQLRILTRRVCVVNRARPNHHHQPRISAAKNIADLPAGFKDRLRSTLRNRQLFFKKNRGKDNFGPFNTKVVCGIKHSSHFTGIHRPR